MSQPEPASAAPPGKFPECTDFEVLQELGQSPKGTIYKARRLIERDIVALKVLRPSVCDKQFLKQLPANAEASFFLAHKGLVRALGCTLIGGSPVLVSELAAGHALSRTLSEGRAFEASQALRMALECADALRFAATHGRHHGRLHPADVIVGETRTRVTGVGLGEQPERRPSTGEPYAFDPLLYIAPEAMPDRGLSATAETRIAADVYSLGAILLHVLTGKPPSTDADRQQATGRLSPVVRQILDRMLSADPAARFDYDSLIAALADAQKAAEGPAPKKTSPKAEDMLAPKPPPTAQRAALIGLAAVALLAMMGFVSVWFLQPRGGTGNGQQEDETDTPPQSQPDRATDPLAHLHGETHAPEQTPDSSGETLGSEQMVPAQSPDSVPAPGENPSQKPSVRPDDGYSVATQQLDALQDLLRQGELKYSPALLRAVRTVQEKAGRTTPTGVRAQKFATEIEQRLARQDESKR